MSGLPTDSNANTEAIKPSQERSIYTYFGLLTLLIYMATPTGYLVDIATSYMMKNQLHASSDTVANFRLVTALPAIVAFLFGFIRDRWSPFGLRDRGFLLVFCPIAASIFVWLAFGKLEIGSLTLGVTGTMIAFGFVGSAFQGLMTLTGQEKLMSGRLSALWNIGLSIPALLAAWSSGWVTEHLTAREIFLVMAGLCFALGAFGLWKSRAVFSHAYDQPLAQHAHFFQDIRRLLRHGAIYPAILINFLFNFAPGSATPLQYYLSNQLHLSDAVYANYTAVFAGSFIPVYVVYGFLCKRFSLKSLLIWGTIITTPQMVPLMFIHSASQAVWMAIPIGLMGGIAAAAYADLAMRSCPPGLQGTLMMTVSGMMVLSARGGDVLGTRIYESDKVNGFLYCVIATTVVYALMLPLIWWIPKHLIATRDAEANPEVQSEVLRELAEG